MTLASDLKPAIEAIRGIPADLGLYVYDVYARTSSRAGAFGLEGTETVSETQVTNGGKRVKVRVLNVEELALGQLGKGSLKVGPITPDYSLGGTTLSSIAGMSLAEQEQFRFRVVGPDIPNGAEFRLSRVEADWALHYTLTLEPIADA